MKRGLMNRAAFHISNTHNRRTAATQQVPTLQCPSAVLSKDRPEEVIPVRKPAERALWQLQGDLWSNISQIKSEPLIHGKVPTLQREEGSSERHRRRGRVTQTTTFTEINTHWIQLLTLIPVTSKWKRRPRQNSNCDLRIYNKGTGPTFSRIRDEDGIFNTAFTSGV